MDLFFIGGFFGCVIGFAVGLLAYEKLANIRTHPAPNCEKPPTGGSN